LNEEFNFTLDVCASEFNYKNENYISKEQDSLNSDWGKNVCWMNPPFNELGKWVKKAYEESLKGCKVICLIPSRTNTNWWHEYCMKGETRYIKGRPKFKGCVHGFPQPLSIVIFHNKDATAFI
jgi:phage N-6-adenine-methyltransferase